MGIWGEQQRDGQHTVLSVSFKPDPTAEPFTFEKLNSGEYDDQLAAFGPVRHIGPANTEGWTPEMALMGMHIAFSAMQEPWMHPHYCGEIDEPRTQSVEEQLRPYVEHMQQLMQARPASSRR